MVLRCALRKSQTFCSTTRAERHKNRCVIFLRKKSSNIVSALDANTIGNSFGQQKGVRQFQRLIAGLDGIRDLS